MIIACATLGNRTYELHRGPNTLSWYLNDSLLTLAYNRTCFDSPAEAVDALWDYTGCTLEVDGWWQPVVDGLDISTAKRPVTVTEQEMILGDALRDELAEVDGLGLETDAGTTPTRAQRALAHRRLLRHYEQLIAEELLEQVALAHDLECELLEPTGEHMERYWIVPADQADRDPACMEPLTTGDTPLAAVLELQRELVGDANWIAGIQEAVAAAQTALVRERP